MPRILVTNDDGYRAPGLHTLARALAPLGEVVVVAPAREASGVSHAMTLHSPVRMFTESGNLHVVDGTPTDCVTLAVFHLLRDRPPDLVVSGINQGSNLGDDVIYSGTVAGAMEGAILGFPAVAISQRLHDGSGRPADRDLAARIAVRIARRLLREGLPPGVLLNVNIPAARALGFRVTRQGKRIYRDVVEERTDPRGRTYFWFAGHPEWAADPESDHDAVMADHVSICPLSIDLTAERFRETLAPWNEDFPDGLGTAPPAHG